MSDMTEWREARRADRMADREADRRDRQAEREEARRDAEAARRRKLADQKAAAEATAKRRAERAAKLGKVTGWVTADPARGFVRFVQACSVIPAVISQIGALDHANVDLLLAALLAGMLEGAAWALVAMGAAAEGERSTRTYRIGAWTAGAVAAGINFAHGWQQYPDHRWVAAVLALSSLVAVWLTDLQTHGGHGPTKAEKKEKAERAAHAKRRAADHPDVRKVADRLLSAAPFGRLSEDDAWQVAWEYVKGISTPGLTADLLAGRLGARSRVAELSALPAPVDLLGPGMPEDPFPALTVPLGSGPSDGVYVDAVPEVLDAAWRAIVEEPETLGGIGLQAPGKAAEKPGRPLDPEHLAKVRELAELFASANRTISTGDVKKLLGGGRNEYLVRLRQQVEAERATGETGGEQ